MLNHKVPANKGERILFLDSKFLKNRKKPPDYLSYNLR
jgi:hypothetical protein